MIEAELPDGTILEFPDGTDQSVVQSTVRKQLGIADDQPEGRGIGEKLARQAGLTARAGVEGAMTLPSLAAEPFRLAMNKALEIAGVEYQFPHQSQAVADALSSIGVTEPENDTERLVQDIGKRATSAMTTMGVGGMVANSASPTAALIGETLVANPVIQAASTVTGPVAAKVAEEAGAGPVGQVVADVAGTLAPSVASFGAPATTRAAFRGGESGRRAVAENIDDFKRAGTTPTVGQATKGRVNRVAESSLSRAPGGAGVIAKKAADQSDEIGARVDQIADDLVPKATATRAGAAIEKGITGKGGFVENFKTTAGRLYDDVDQHIDTAARVPVAKTQKFLAAETAPIKGAESTSRLLSNKFLEDVGVSLSDDVQRALDDGGIAGLPYAALKEIRTKVGEKLSNLTLIDDVSKGQLKQLYGALSDDLTTAAKASGPKAAKAAMRADSYYKAGMGRIEAIERVINKNGGPEKVFQAAMSGTKEGATTLRTVMKSIRPEDRRMVTAAVVRRMGKATPGMQDETAEAFSNNTFLTNWARLSPEARGALFGQMGEKFSKNMDSLAKVASNLREGSKIFANPSGTQAATALQISTGGAAYLFFTGQFQALAGLMAAVGGADLSARLMVNPRFVNWLAQSTKTPIGGVPALMNSLASTANKSGDRDLATVYAVLKEGENQPADQQQGQNQDQQAP